MTQAPAAAATADAKRGPAGEAAAASPFAPLKTRAFALIWGAAIIGNIGLWLRDVASAWMMTELSPSPLLVSLVQAAGTLPIFLLALPAGALADLLDRRRWLITLQLALAGVSLALAGLTAAGMMTPWLLLGLTLAGGIGAALSGPAWASLAPMLVPRPQLRAATALNSMGINLSRAIGPALGGAIIATLGTAAAYLGDVLTYAATIAALLLWRAAPRPAGLPPEPLGSAILSGLRFAAGSPGLQAVLWRAAAWFPLTSAFWALLPLVARQQLAGGPGLYGLLLGAIGIGAVGGGLILPRLAKLLGPDRLMLAAQLLVAAGMAVLALVGNAWIAGLALAAMGAGWLAAVSTLNLSAQLTLPDWVRARGIAVYLMVFFGGMTGGPVLWGAIAGEAGVPEALLLAAGSAAAVALLALRIRLPSGADDLTPSGQWPEPPLAGPVALDRGPVLVTLTYRIDPADIPAFHEALAGLAVSRRRDGAYRWRIYQDVADPWRWIECFEASSWVEHLRQHERVTEADRAAQARVFAFHRGESGPAVTHWVGP